MITEARKPILCLDFDGVCHSYESGWKGADNIPDAPVYGMRNALKRYEKDFRIVVFSSRSKQEGGIEAMREWFEIHAPDVDLEFWEEKPPALVTIDDRAITFDGKWPENKTLLDFKPWNKRGEHLWKKHACGEALATLHANNPGGVLNGTEALYDSVWKVLNYYHNDAAGQVEGRDPAKPVVDGEKS